MTEESLMGRAMESWVTEPCVALTHTLMSFYGDYMEMLRKVASSKKSARRAAGMIQGLDTNLKEEVSLGRIKDHTYEMVIGTLEVFMEPLVTSATQPAAEFFEEAGERMATVIAEEIITCQCGVECKGEEITPKRAPRKKKEAA